MNQPKPMDSLHRTMPEIGVTRLAVIFANLIAATAAGLTLVDVLDSSVVLGGAILTAIVALLVQLTVQYRGYRHG